MKGSCRPAFLNFPPAPARGGSFDVGSVEQTRMTHKKLHLRMIHVRAVRLVVHFFSFG